MIMLAKFEDERAIAVKRLTASISPHGGMVSLETLQDVISTAFNGGVLAAINKSIVQSGAYSVEAAEAIRELVRD